MKNKQDINYSANVMANKIFAVPRFIEARGLVYMRARLKICSDFLHFFLKFSILKPKKGPRLIRGFDLYVVPDGRCIFASLQLSCWSKNCVSFVCNYVCMYVCMSPDKLPGVPMNRFRSNFTQLWGLRRHRSDSILGTLRIKLCLLEGYLWNFTDIQCT